MYYVHKHIMVIEKYVINCGSFNDHFDDDCLVYFDAQQANTSDLKNLTVLAGQLKAAERSLQVAPDELEYEKQRPLFAWLSIKSSRMHIVLPYSMLIFL